MDKTKALTLSGSIRTGSYNAMLARHVGHKLCAAGAEVTDLDLDDYRMPLFNEDLEPDSVPAAAVELADMFRAHPVIFIACPEYNGGATPLLVNTLAWLSRQKPGVWRHAVFGLGGVSSGKYGAIFSLSHVRDSISKVGGLVAPGLLGIGPASEAFDDEGRLVDAGAARKVDTLVADLMAIRRG